MAGATTRSGDTVPFSALGLRRGEEPPRRFTIRIATQIDLDSILGGLVRVAETFEYDESSDDDPSVPHRRAKGPVPGGLFDERIFGPLPSGVDPLLALSPDTGVHPAALPQSGLFGCVALPEPVVSTWSTRFAAEAEPVRLTRIPVLPPAMRPTFSAGDRVLTSDLTTHYSRLLNRCRRLARLVELGAPEIILDNERWLLQQMVDALLVDGVTVFDAPADETEDEDEDPEEWVTDPEEVAERIEYGEKPKRRLLSLQGHMLLREPSRFFRWLDAELSDNPRVLSAERWPEDVHLWRAYLEAACLEIVPLAADGGPDLELLERARLDRTIQITHKVHELVFREGLGVLHVPGDRAPHVDVYAFREGGHVVLLTGTAGQAPGPGTELACLLSDEGDEAARAAVMRKIWRLAQQAADRGGGHAPGHVVDFGEPLAPGSALTGFVLLDGDALPFARLLADILPSHPRVLLAAGVTSAEIARTARDGSAALAGAILRELGARTVLARRDAVAASEASS